MRHVIPYFGTPSRLLSGRGREFISAIWTKLLRSLGIQPVHTSPYHPEGNAINKRSNRTLNNMLRARLLEGPSAKAWVDKVPGIMLTINAIPHEPHGFSASMIATGREPMLTPDITSDASPSSAAEDPAEYLGTIRQVLQLTHQQTAAPPTPTKRTSKLAPRWKGPYRVCRIPNEYQDGEVERTIHVNHAKPAKFTAPDLPEPVPLVEEPRPPLGYLPAGFTHKPSKPRAPPVNRNEAAIPPPAVPAVPAAPLPTAAPANQNPEPAPPRRSSPRLNPELGHAHAIKSQPPARQPHSATKSRTLNRPEMAHTYPFTVSYNDSMGAKENPVSFASLRLLDLRNGQSQYLSTLKQLRDALPKTLDPASHFALRGHIARPGQLCLRHSMRAALWFMLPSDGEFHRSSTSLQYYLTRQVRRVVLRGGDVTRPPLESHLNWIPDPAPIPPRNNGKENLPPSAEPRKLPRKIRPRRQRKEHHHHLGATGSTLGTSQPPRCARSTPVKYPQPLQHPQHPQPPRPAANHNSERPDLLNQAELGPSISKDTTTRSRRDNFSGSNLSFNFSQWSHRDYFSGSPYQALNKNWHMTDPLREASSVSLIAVWERSDPTRTPPRTALPDVSIDVGAEAPETAATSRIPRADRPPAALEIPSSHPEQSEPHRCPETHGKWFRPPTWGHKRPRTSSPPSPHCPRKRPSQAGRWCE